MKIKRFPVSKKYAASVHSIACLDSVVYNKFVSIDFSNGERFSQSILMFLKYVVHKMPKGKEFYSLDIVVQFVCAFLENVIKYMEEIKLRFEKSKCTVS